MGIPDEDRNWEYRLRRGESAAEGVTRIAAGRAEEALARLRPLRAGGGDSAAAIHGARKDLKKLRTVLRLIRDALPAPAHREASATFRDAGRALSASRDAEVKLETLRALSDRFDGLPSGAVESWLAILESDRDAATGTRAEQAAVAEATELLESGLEQIRSWELERDGWRLLGPGLRRTYGRGRKAMKVARRERSEDSLHEWRKRSKDLWYELRLLGEAWPAVLDPSAEEAHSLADLLGDHHDLAVLRADLGERRLGELETASLEAAIGEREEELAASALALGGRLYAEPAKAFSRRLRGYWKAWRG